MPTPQQKAGKYSDEDVASSAGASAAPDITTTETQPGNPLTAEHPMDTLRANLHEVQQGAQPGDGMMMGALKNFGAGGADVIHGIGHAVLHPVDTISDYAHEQEAQAEKPIGQQLKDAVTSGRILGMGGEGLVSTAKGMLYAPMRTLGSLGTGAIIGGAPGGLAGDAATLRSAAIGDTDAAALKGLRVPPKGKKVLPMQSSVQTARPYLQGASSLEDLQTRVPQAKAEIFGPYKDTIDAVGHVPTMGPDGPTTIGDLENERQELSAMNRGLKTGDPSALRLAEQKGMSQAESLAREKAIQDHLDPALSRYGINPQGIRQAYGSVARIGNQVEGRSTLLEKPQPSGLGKIGQISLKQPLQAPGQILSGMRDIVAGRPWLSMSPTDIGVREGFANAGPKPDFGQYTPFKPTGLLGKPPIASGASPEVGGTPEGFRPPPFYHDTDAMRTGRLLPAPPIELPGQLHGTPQFTFHHDTTPMRLGRLLPAPPPEMEHIPLHGGGEYIEGTPSKPYAMGQGNGVTPEGNPNYSYGEQSNYDRGGVTEPKGVLLKKKTIEGKK